MKNKTAFVLLLSPFFMTACVTEKVSTTPGMKFSEAAVISVQSPDIGFKPGTSFAWLPDAINYYRDKRLQGAPIKKILEDEIAANLKAKGMKLTPSPKQSQYSIAYTAALESALDDSTIIRQFGLLPGNSQVPVNDQNIEKGSLIVYVFDNKNNQMIWRSAAQVGVKFDTPAQERKKRVKQVVAEMFITFPLAVEE